MTGYDSFTDFNVPVVIDNGSGTIKAGMAGENMPSAILPTLVATPKTTLHPAWKSTPISASLRKEEDGDKFYGEDAQNNRAFCKLHYPIKNGIIEHPEYMSHLWQNIFKEHLQTSMTEHPILLTDSPLNPFSNRAKIAQILFETKSVPALYFAPPAVLALYARGKQNGCVLDCGEGVTSCVPIYDGYILPHTLQRTNIAGECITDEFIKLLKLQSHQSSIIQTLDRATTKEVIKSLKEKKCEFLVPNNDRNKKLLDINNFYNYSSVILNKINGNVNDDDVKSDVCNDDECFILPDGNLLDISICKYLAGEVLFQPMIIGSEEVGICDLLFNCIEKCDLDLRRNLYSNIILCGGTTLMKGFGQRLVYELQKKKRRTKINIYAPRNRDLSAWIGGSLLSFLETFRPMWIRNKDYQENGPQILLRNSMLLLNS